MSSNHASGTATATTTVTGDAPTTISANTSSITGMDKHDRVAWRTVNGTRTGEIVSPFNSTGDWFVRLDNGKYVIVNEKSFIGHV